MKKKWHPWQSELVRRGGPSVPILRGLNLVYKCVAYAIVSGTLACDLFPLSERVDVGVNGCSSVCDWLASSSGCSPPSALNQLVRGPAQPPCLG